MILDRLPPPEKRLLVGDTFTFSCEKGLACFGTCCRNRYLTLTPYDVLRLKNSLKMHSDEFLVRHTVYRLDPESGFPVISLKMGSDSERECPFLTPVGCSIYRDRPTACRLFPLARASGMQPYGAGHDEFFFFLDTKNCLGRKEGRAQILEEYLAAQGVIEYRKINDKMLDILFHPWREKGKPLSSRQLQKIIVACYNVDVFREFVLKADFIEAYQVDDPTRSLIDRDDVALLDLGFTYLKTALFQRPVIVRAKV